MKHGIINCSCGHEFYFEKANTVVGYDVDHNPIHDASLPLIINCPKCDGPHDIINYPDKVASLSDEEGDEDGTDI